ncbi:MAG TPA: hypothetical protein VGC13_29235 [Longimicrobium sp.]|jgi:hypothetical protein|uniref:hypothetical protein n=1 Tax=Longimicrobium sp. TaxID=2029185 RepID=UPI002ED8DF2F
MIRMMRTATAVLTALVMAACAGNAGEAGGPSEGGGGEYLRVTVENDGTIPSQVRVYLVPGSGQHMLIGTMSTLGTETLTTTLPSIGGTYQLRAEGGTGYTRTSPRVTLRGNETIVWDMRQNLIRLGSR